VRALPVAVTLMNQAGAWKGRPGRSRPIPTRRCTTKGSGPVWTPGPTSLALRTPRRCAGIRGARAGWWPGPRPAMAYSRLVI